MSNYQNNLNHWRHQAREEEDRKARMNMGIGNFLAEISSSESEEYQTRDPGYEPTQSVKDYSQPLYCKICHIQCNSDSMLETHLNGSKHLKKMKQLGQEDVSTGTNSTSKKVLAATAKSVKNVPKFVSLETKLHLERRGEPVIGLDQIEVIKPRTNPEMYEPKYRCTLCCVTAEIDPIYQHLVGAKHRTKYIKNILGQPVHTKEDIKWYAEENDNKNPKQMRIIQSDSEYESVMPQTQLEKEKQQQNSRKGVSLSEVKIGDNPADILLNNIANASCKNEDDAKLSYEVAHRLILKLAEYVTEKAANPVKEMEEWNEILNQISRKYQKAKQASIKKEVFKEEENSRKRPNDRDERNGDINDSSKRFAYDHLDSSRPSSSKKILHIPYIKQEPPH